MSHAKQVAFFDVDHALVTCRILPSFLGCAAGADERARYRALAGRTVSEVAAAGEAWFEGKLGTRHLFHRPLLRAFDRHRNMGHLTVLMSSAFSACLDPIAEYVGADVVLGSMPEVSGDHYTGGLLKFRDGAGKAEATRELLANTGIPRALAYAYGSDSSDLEMMSTVDNPVVVGSDPVLADMVRFHSWRWVRGIEDMVMASDRHR